MGKNILLLGSTGKMGIALKSVFEPDYDVIGKNSKDFDAFDFNQVRKLIEDSKPDIVVNTVALLGIDPCEQEPEKALRLNTLYPKFLAELSKEKGFLLAHFSTDAVFNDRKSGFYTEKDTPRPLNIYGFTKYGGDCYIQAITRHYYIFRISVLFGEVFKNNQFVEKMLEKIKQGQKILKVSGDIILSPTYSRDVAVQVRDIIEAEKPFGVYHVANKGKASLYELMKEIVKNMGLDARVEKASYKDFPYIGIKNTCTPLKSGKVASLRPWKEAVKEYCCNLKKNIK